VTHPGDTKTNPTPPRSAEIHPTHLRTPLSHLLRRFSSNPPQECLNPPVVTFSIFPGTSGDHERGLLAQLKIYLERTQLLLHFTPFQKKELVISPISRISVIGSFLSSRFLPHKWCSERTCVGYEWIKHLLQPHALGSLCGVRVGESIAAYDCVTTVVLLCLRWSTLPRVVTEERARWCGR
jgi:hypothetical protein